MRGREITTGLPKTVVLSPEEVRYALRDQVDLIVDTVVGCLAESPPELAQDIIYEGIHLVGGGAMLRGLANRLADETEVPVHLVATPLECVVLGAGHLPRLVRQPAPDLRRRRVLTGAARSLHGQQVLGHLADLPVAIVEAAPEGGLDLGAVEGGQGHRGPPADGRLVVEGGRGRRAARQGRRWPRGRPPPPRGTAGRSGRTPAEASAARAGTADALPPFAQRPGGHLHHRGVGVVEAAGEVDARDGRRPARTPAGAPRAPGRPAPLGGRRRSGLRAGRERPRAVARTDGGIVGQAGAGRGRVPDVPGQRRRPPALGDAGRQDVPWQASWRRRRIRPDAGGSESSRSDHPTTMTEDDDHRGSSRPDSADGAAGSDRPVAAGPACARRCPSVGPAGPRTATAGPARTGRRRRRWPWVVFILVVVAVAVASRINLNYYAIQPGHGPVGPAVHHRARRTRATRSPTRCCSPMSRSAGSPPSSYLFYKLQSDTAL